MTTTIEAVAQFLYTEARLMDENRYADWLELFADPCTYWIPSNADDIDPSREVSILYADRAMLDAHVKRLGRGKAFAQSPASRMRRLVSNVEAREHGPELAVFANFAIIEIRKHAQRVHAGRSEYRLQAAGGTFRITFKKINLVGIDEYQDNLTFLL